MLTRYLKYAFLVLITYNAVFKSTAQKVNVDSLIQLLPSVSNEKKVDILNWIAYGLNQSDYNKSIRYSTEALSLAKKINYTWGYSSSLSNISYAYYYRSNYRMAMEYSLKKIKFDDSLGYRLRMADTYNFIGNIYYLVKDYSRALDYYNKSLEIYKEKNDEKGLGNIYTCIGNIHEANKEIQKAEHYYNLSLKLHEKEKNQVSIAINNNNLGNIYYIHYKDTAAIRYFINARNCLPEVTDMSTHALVYNNYGDYFFWLQQYDSALYYLNKGMVIAEHYSIPLYVKEISNSLSRVYAKKLLFEKAYQYLIRFNHLNDSLFNNSISGKMAFLDYQYNLEKTENLRTIQFLKQQRAIKARLWLFIFITIVVAFLGVVFIIYYKSIIKQEKLSKEKINLESIRLQEQLDFRNKEIVIIMTNLFERNELIRHVIQKLQLLNPLLKRTNQTHIEDIIRDLKGKYHENILNEFEYRFQKVHIDFYKKLSEDYPTLTSNDLRLCAFLRMNMNTKDIASLTHQTVNSIEVARTRLRKKLTIHQTDIDLVAFLSKF